MYIIMTILFYHIGQTERNLSFIGIFACIEYLYLMVCTRNDLVIPCPYSDARTSLDTRKGPNADCKKYIQCMALGP